MWPCHDVLIGCSGYTRFRILMAVCLVRRVKRLAALCTNYDGVIAAGVYMTLKTPGSSSGSAAAASGDAASRDMDSSGADSGDGPAAGAAGGSTGTGESADEDGEDAALAGGGATAAITRQLRSIGGVSSSSSSSSSDAQQVGVGVGGGLDAARGGRRQLLYGSGQVGRAVLQAGEAAAADPDGAVQQAVHRLNRLHAKMEAEGATRANTASLLSHRCYAVGVATRSELPAAAAAAAGPACVCLAGRHSRPMHEHVRVCVLHHLNRCCASPCRPLPAGHDTVLG
jgi:hypothetical protein